MRKSGWTSAVVLSAVTGACAAQHQARGLVLEVDRDAKALTVSHEAIPGFMDAMVMPFAVRDAAQLADVHAGDRIRFRVRVRGRRTEIDRIELLSSGRVDAGRLRSPAVATLVDIGAEVPDFTLTDHRGDPVSLTALRGRIVIVTFIYTRCPLPDYCPRMIGNLDAVRRRFGERLGRDLALLAITFDPKYDTPQRLKSYAEGFNADVRGWHFLTGSVEQIARVCGLFGLEFWPEEGLITHTLVTALIDRSGRLLAVVEGRDYTGRQLGDLVELALRQF